MSIFNGNELKDPVAVLRQERSAQPNMATHLEHLKKMYRHDPWHKLLSHLAVSVEPVDRVLGRDRNAPSAHAFLNGGLLAVDMTYRSLPADINRAMLSIPMGGNIKEEDYQVQVHKVAEGIIDSGDFGYTLYPELAEVIDSWEDEISPEVRYQPFVKRGFGAVMYIAHEACEAVAYQRMFKAYEDGVDWDADLATLLPPPETA